VDVSIDPHERRRTARRRLYRFGLPIAAVLLIAAAIVAVSWYGYERNRSDVLALTGDLMEALEQRASLEVERFLTDAADSAWVAAAATGEPLMPEGQPYFERIAMEVLRAKPQIAMVYAGGSNGDYLLLRRGELGGVDTQRISHTPEGREIKWAYRRADGTVDRSEVVADTGYDPRTRPWYHLAVQTSGAAWTDAYVFFTDRKPGVTASLALRDASDHVHTVIGIDIHLDRLSTFLANLKLGRSGRAMILDESGSLIAYPDGSALLRQDGSSLRRARLDDLGDPVLAQIGDRLGVSGPTRTNIDVKGNRYILASFSLNAVVGKNWSLLFVAPEADFTGFVETNNRNALLYLCIVIVLAAGLAMLLVSQGLATDGMARLVEQRRRAMDAQSLAFEVLGRIASTFNVKDQASTRRLTETVAGGAQAGRVVLWQCDPARGLLVCVDAYETATRCHTDSIHIARDDCSGLFEAMRRGEEFAVADTQNDWRCAKLFASYFGPADMCSFIAVPIGPAAPSGGYLWIEYRDRGSVSHRGYTFARAVAQMIAPHFARETVKTDLIMTSAPLRDEKLPAFRVGR
jgi:hypothetical protein